MKLLCVDDHEVVLAGLAAALTQYEAIESVVGVPNSNQARSELLKEIPDVAILDINLGLGDKDNGIILAKELHRTHPSVGILVLTTFGVVGVLDEVLAIRDHSIGFLLKDTPTSAIVDSAIRVARGETVIDPEMVRYAISRPQDRGRRAPLSDRELDVLQKMASGYTNAKIAQELQISQRTVEVHVARVLEKLRIPNTPDTNRRVMAVATFLRGGD